MIVPARNTFFSVSNFILNVESKGFVSFFLNEGYLYLLKYFEYAIKHKFTSI